MKEPSLREVEKRTHMSYHQDGLLDIFVGVHVLLFGLGSLVNTLTEISTWFIIPAIFPAIIVPLWISAKKQITMTRIGYMKFRSGGANTLTAVLIGLTIAGLGVFAVFTFVSTTQPWASALRNVIVSQSTIIIGIGYALISSLFAYTMGLKRLYAYGLSALALSLTGHLITITFEYLLVTIGLAIIINGFVLLIRFMRKFKLIQDDKVSAKKSLWPQEYLSVIHEPTRLMIMSQLYVVENADLFLQHQLQMTTGNLSSHLSKHKEVGHVKIVKVFIEQKPHTALKLTKKGPRCFE